MIQHANTNHGKVFFCTSSRQILLQELLLEMKSYFVMMINGTIQQEDITILNLSVSNDIDSNIVKQNVMWIKGETDKYIIIIVSDFITSQTKHLVDI